MMCKVSFLPRFSASPVFHVTRSRVQTRAQEKAVEIINEISEPVVVDKERLVRLLDLTVLLTEDYIIPRLEKLYTLFAQCVYEHRKDYNKTAMIEVCIFQIASLKYDILP